MPDDDETSAVHSASPFERSLRQVMALNGEQLLSDEEFERLFGAVPADEEG